MFRFWKHLNAFFSRLTGKAPPDSEGIAPDTWCLVGNVVEEHPHGEQHETTRGSKHFSPGTKVYCLPPQWGDGYEKIVAVGLHRGSRRWITVVMPADQITNWRARPVYQPAVRKRLQEGYRRDRDGHLFNRQWRSRAEVDSWARHLRSNDRVSH